MPILEKQSYYYPRKFYRNRQDKKYIHVYKGPLSEMISSQPASPPRLTRERQVEKRTGTGNNNMCKLYFFFCSVQYSEKMKEIKITFF